MMAEEAAENARKRKMRAERKLRSAKALKPVPDQASAK
jgi:hypothetical protein